MVILYNSLVDGIRSSQENSWHIIDLVWKHQTNGNVCDFLEDVNIDLVYPARASRDRKV